MLIEVLGGKFGAVGFSFVQDVANMPKAIANNIDFFEIFCSIDFIELNLFFC